MNNKFVYGKVDEIKKDLLTEKLVNDYFNIVKEIINNKELQGFLNAQSYYKTKMVINENKENETLYLEYKQKYDEFSIKINKHPLYINYKNIKEEVLFLVDEIKDVLKL